MNNTIYRFDELLPEQQRSAGGKGGVLARLYQSGYPVPDGLVILPAAFAADELQPRSRRLRGNDHQAAFAGENSVNYG